MNAIATECLRADLVPLADAQNIKKLLCQYLGRRVAFYETRFDNKVFEINEDTSRLQDEMWNAVNYAAAAQPNSINALVTSGMNDVINRQGYPQAAW